MDTNLLELADVLDEIGFFERERTDHQFVELAILLYDCGVNLRKVERVLGWIGVERPHVAAWTWIQRFGQRWSETGRRPAADLPAVVLMDETVIKQHTNEVHAVRGGRSGDAQSLARVGCPVEKYAHNVTVSHEPRRVVRENATDRGDRRG